MTLRFILGRAGTGKSYTCFNEITREVKINPLGSPIILLVPGHCTFQAEYELATNWGIPGSMRAQVLSFHRLAYRVFQEMGGPVEPYLGALAKNLLLRGVAEKHQAQLKVFGGISAEDGFLDVLSSTISELKKYYISPDSLAAAIQELKNRGEQGLLADKLEDLLYIYRDFEECIVNTYSDPDSHLDLLVERLAASTRLKDAEVWVDGFVSFSPQEYRVLGAILQRARRVNVTLSLDSTSLQGGLHENHVFFSGRETYDTLCKLAGDFGMAIEPTVQLAAPCRLQEFPAAHYLEDNYFKPQVTEPCPDTQGINLISATNPRAELEGVAREILRLCREENYRYRDIQVMARDLQAYSELIAVIFEDYGIPYFMDCQVSLLHHPLVELLRSALEVILSDWDYHSIFRYLRTDLVPISREQVDSLENYVLEHGIAGEKWTEGKDWSYRRVYSLGEDSEPSEADLKQLARVNEARVQAAKELLTFQRQVKACTTTREFTHCLFGLLEKLQVREQLENWGRREQENQRRSLHAQAWEEVLELFDQLVAAGGSQPMDFELYAQTLFLGLDNLQLSTSLPGFDQVQVSSVEGLTGNQARAAFILGINDAAFPTRMSSGGMFSDSERNLLAKSGIRLGPGARRRQFDENFLIYTALTRASERLYLSYPLADAEGKSLIPSQVIGRIKELFPSLRESLVGNLPDGQDDLQFVSRSGPTLGLLGASLSSLPPDKRTLWWAVYNWSLQSPEMYPQLNRLKTSLTRQNLAEPLSPGTAGALYGEKLRVSVSRLEKFNSCRFAHFAAYGLRLKERTLYRLDAAGMGELFHAALQQFGNKLQEEGLDWGELNRGQCAAYCRSIVENLAPRLKSEILLSTSRLQYILEKLQRTLESSLWAMIEHAKRSEFRPVALEAGFGPGRELPGITYTLPDGKTVELNGRIDRIDLATAPSGEKYLRIIDYKSGKTGIDLDEVYYGLKLQLLTYLKVAVTHSPQLAEEPAKPGGMLYVYLRDPLISCDGPLEQTAGEKKWLLQYKMKGFVLADPGVIGLMDNQLVKGNSDIIPAGIKVDGGFRADSSVLSEDEFTSLNSYLDKTLFEASRELATGSVEMNPYKRRQQNSCTYCEYKPLCSFDPSLDENSYRNLKPMDKDEVWARINDSKGVAHNG